MGFQDFLLYLALATLVVYIARINNLFVRSQGEKKAKEIQRKSLSSIKKRKSQHRRLGHYEDFYKSIGFRLSEERYEDIKYRITRLDIRCKRIGRAIKVEELCGIFKIVRSLGLFIFLTGLILTGNRMYAIFLLSLFVEYFWFCSTTLLIQGQDMEIEEDFYGLYVLLYSRLKKGVDTRLAPTLDEYLTSMRLVHGENSHLVIKQFVLDLRNNIEIYADDSMAVGYLREKYKSDLIINFCNLAIQSLSGVDNMDKLLAFDMELSQKNLDMMTRRAEKSAAKGRRRVYLIYIIIAQFVILSWSAKLAGLGMLKRLFGGVL